MTYSDDEIREFRGRWREYIDELARLKLAVPADEMHKVDDCMATLRHLVDETAAEFEDEQ